MAMLKQRAASLSAGDVDGYLTPLSAAARAVEEPIARGAISVPLASIDLTLGEATVSVDGTAMRDAEIKLLYRYRDLPEDNPFRLELRAGLVRGEDGSWTVTTSQPGGEVPLPAWASGPVEVRHSGHFLALFRPGLSRLEEILALAETARERLLSRLTLDADPVHLVTLARTSAEYRQFSGSDGSVGLALNEFQSSVAYAVRPESRQMFIDLDAVLYRPSRQVFEGKQDVSPVEVFQHELGHLALTRFDRPSTPGWVSEAAAMYLSGERRAEGWAELVTSGQLDRLSLVVLSGGQSLANAPEYAYVNAAAFYLVETFGAQQFWEFYRNFKDIPDQQQNEPASRAKGAERLVRRWFNIDLEQLDAHTRDWIEKAVR